MWEEVEKAWRDAYVPAPLSEVGLDIWKRVPLAALPDYPLPAKTLRALSKRAMGGISRSYLEGLLK